MPTCHRLVVTSLPICHRLAGISLPTYTYFFSCVLIMLRRLFCRHNSLVATDAIAFGHLDGQMATCW